MSNQADALIKELHRRLEKEVKTLPLGNNPTDIVPGEGSGSAEIMFIGEAPGYYESVQRRPFVGRSGQLLREVIKEIALKEDQYYISNIVKIRPPENRDPLPAEILAFKPYLDQEITILHPQLIVTLGRYSMAKFLPDVRISQVHGRLHKLHWESKLIFVLPMYHPAAGLRSTQIKMQFIEDMQKIPKVLEWINKKKEFEQEAEQIKNALL